MLKHTRTYTDYNQEQRTEDFWFNLSKGEVAEMELRTPGGLVQHFEKIAAEKDNNILVDLFKNTLLSSYGVKAPDGKHFIKSREIVEAFTQTEAYSDLFVDLIQHADFAAAFMNGIISQTPQELLTPVNKVVGLPQ